MFKHPLTIEVVINFLGISAKVMNMCIVRSFLVLVNTYRQSFSAPIFCCETVRSQTLNMSSVT